MYQYVKLVVTQTADRNTLGPGGEGPGLVRSFCVPNLAQPDSSPSLQLDPFASEYTSIPASASRVILQELPSHWPIPPSPSAPASPRHHAPSVGPPLTNAGEVLHSQQLQIMREITL